MKFFFSSKRVVAPTPQASAVAAAPGDIDDLILQGNRLEDAGDLEAAHGAYARAIDLAPKAFRAYLNLGNVLRLMKRDAQAAEHYRQAIRLNPEYPGAHLNLGNTLLEQQAFDEAAESYRTALQRRPDWAEAWFGLGCALEKAVPLARTSVIDAYTTALRLDPTNGKAVANLAAFLGEGGEFESARALLEDFLARSPNNVAALRIRAAMNREQGYLETALADYRHILDLCPDDEVAMNFYLWTLNFVPDATPAAILSDHLKYGDRLLSRTPRCTLRAPRGGQTRLKIGYVSPDFRRHPISCFVEPLLREHDRATVEVYCYYNFPKRDEITQRLAGLTEHWRDIANVSDEDVAQGIIADGIDILVDLAGHTADNRLGLFARKAAPIQCTWLGYLCTSGLRTMDYRICDAYTDPFPQAEAWQVEKPLRLPDSQWCYQAPISVPSPSTLPRLTNGHWTFGSSNQASKLNERTLRIWAQLLDAIPGSRLQLIGVSDPVLANRIRAIFQEQGVSPGRIDVNGRIPVEEYFSFYRGIDIALDTFPYNGATTTCDALLMGVPVAVVAGHRAIARGGVSLLTTLGLQKWIAPSQEDYVQMLIGHTEDAARVSALRSELPKWMRDSALMDARRFARNLEASYRKIWQRACDQSSTD